MKHCPKCNQDLPMEAFTPSQRRRPSVYCASCQRAYNREYFQANKARLSIINRAYATEHEEDMRAYRRAYQDRNPDMYEQRKPYYQERYQAKRDEIRAYQRAYQKRTPELGGRRTMRYYARKCGAEGTHTAADWKALRVWFGNCCLCCGATKKLEADHVIPLDCGGSDYISNIQPLCRSCNASKRTQTTDYRDPEHLAAFLTFYSSLPAPMPLLCGMPPIVRPT